MITGTYRKKFKPNVHQVYEMNEQENDVHSADEIGYLFYSGGNELVTGDVGGTNIILVIDSGASANMLSVESWKQMKWEGLRIML